MWIQCKKWVELNLGALFWGLVCFTGYWLMSSLLHWPTDERGHLYLDNPPSFYESLSPYYNPRTFLFAVSVWFLCLIIRKLDMF